MNQDQQYWLEQLAGELVPSRFFPDQRLATGNYQQMQELTFTLPEKVAQSLVSLAKGAAPAVYLVLLTGVEYLLATYTGQEDILLGVPVFKQANQGGKLINHLLPLRTQFNNKIGFKELLMTVKKTLSEATQHQNYPLKRVIQELPGFDRSHSQVNGQSAQSLGLADVIVLLDNIQSKEVLAQERYEVLFAFHLHSDQRITGTIEYNGGLYERATVQIWVEQLIHFFTQVGQKPGLLLADLQLISATEEAHLINHWYDPNLNYPATTIDQLFFAQVNRYPDRIALVDQGTEITYGELGERVLRLAQILRQRGVQRETIVGIMTPPSMEMVVGILAILTAGGGYLPIDPEYPTERIQYILNDSQATHFLVVPELTEKIDFVGEVIQLTTELSERLEISFNELAKSEPEDLAYIIYTSGSTGKPKGVMIEHKNVVRLLYNEHFQFDFTEEDCWCLFHSFCFDFSVWEMYGALLYGGKLVIVPKDTARNPEAFRQLLIREQVTVLNQTPTAFSNLIYEEMKVESQELAIRYVIFGGEALKPAMLKSWQNRYPKTRLINMYGITETTVHVTYKEIGIAEIETNVSNIGEPIPTLSCYILDDCLRLLPMGAPGEICVGGDGVARGYLNRPELTKERFIQNPYRPEERLYRSGDLGRLLPNGEIEYLRRIDRQVKIRGFRIELGEIESQLLRHPEIQDVAVLTLTDPLGNSSLAAYLVSKVEHSVGELREFLAHNLPDYMIPAYFVHLTGLPITINGKIDRQALPDPFKMAGQSYVAPKSELERELANIWSDVLGIQEIGILDSFTEMGGDSIKAVRLIVKINQVLKKNLQIKDIYLNQTIAELASYLESNLVDQGLDLLGQGHLLLEGLKEKILADEKLRSKIPESVVDFYPLSPIQQGMVFYSSIKPEEPIYHDQFLYPVQFHQFDLQLFVQGFRLLAKKHPILRTTFLMKDLGEPMQLVHSELNPEITLDDLTSLVAIEQSQTIRDYLRHDDLARKFGFNNDPLWRMKLFKVSATDYYIAFSFHHAILDGWSVANLIPEFMQVYQCLLSGTEIKQTELQRSYRDYVGMGLARHRSQEVEAFWQSTLAGYSRNKLPFNIFSRKIDDRSQSKINRKHLDRGLLDRLEEQAKAHNVALKSLFLSGYIYLLQMITNEGDIVTGVVTNDRPVLEDGDKILGCFLNSIPIRIQVPKMIRKSDLLHRVDEYLRAAKPYETFLGEIADLIGEKNHLKNPIFDTLFNYIDFHVLENVDTKLVQGSQRLLDVEASEMTNTLFDFEVSKTMGNLKVWIKYSPNYFADTEIETALQIYLRILEMLAKEEDLLFTATELIPPEMKQQLLYDFNQTQTRYSVEKTLHQLFEEQVKVTPEQIAVRLGSETITYQELNDKANQVARLLQTKGVNSGDLIGLIANRNSQMIAGILGILKAGGAYVPIDPAYPKARQEYILANSGVSLLLTNLKQLNPSGANVVEIDEEILARYRTENLELSKDSRDLAYVIYTSGSTGRPKGVMIEHHSAVNLIQWVNQEYQVGCDDRLLFITSICFDLSVYDIFGILAAGGQVVIAQTEQVQDPEELKRLMYEEKITFWDSVPTTMNHLVNILDELEVEAEQLNLRLVFLSGDWIPVALPGRIREYFPKAQVISLGGATEGTVWSNYYSIPVEELEANPYQTSIPYGRPLANNYFYILNETREIVLPGVAGELYIGGVGVAQGYMNDPERTKQAFVSNPFLADPKERMYKTGDLGRMMPDGNMEFLGRIDNQVKIRGFRVELGEIENLLLKHPEVRETVVVDRMDNQGNKYLCTYLVSDRELSIAELKEFLAKELPNYMVPAYFRQMLELPLNPNGKIDRSALPEPEDQLLAYEEMIPPRDEVEERLAVIWSSLLNRDEISVTDNFFDLGGHSLTATQLSLKIFKEFQVEVSLKVIFEAPTLAELANQIKVAEGVDYAAILPAPQSKSYPVSSAQKRLYVLSQMDGVKTSYNLPAALIITGPLDYNRLNASFHHLVQRHEALRTSFYFVEDQLVQQIHSEVEFQIEVGQVEPAQIDLLLEELVQPFDLSQAPLFRVGLYRLDAEKHLLFYDLHHIVADGVSMAMVMEEFARLYGGEELPKLRIQYKDFAVWQKELFATEKLEAQEAYWLQQFTGEIPLLNLSYDWPRPQVMDYIGATLTFELDDLTVKKLDRLAAQTGTTRYMILLAVYTTLLGKYSGQDDLVVGTPIAGRAHTDLEAVMGVFINTLAMRNQPKGEKSFLQYLAEVKEKALMAYENQDYPFEMLVDKLNLERDLSRNPLFDTMFALQNIHLAEQEMGDLQFRTYQSVNQIAKFDLTLNAYESKQGINYHLEYRTSLFEPATIEQMARHFLHLLQEVVVHPEQKLSELSLLSDEERVELLGQMNPVMERKTQDRHLQWVELFAATVAKRPTEIAVIVGDQTLTYAELNTKSNQLAQTLRQKGVGRETIVGLMTSRSAHLLVGMVAILKAGGAYLPIDPDFPPERIRYMLQDSGAVFLLTEERVLDQSGVLRDAFQGCMLNLDAQESYAIELSDLPVINEPNDLSYLIYTSGSTGKPKGTMIENRSVCNFILGISEKIAFLPQKRILSLTTPSFDIFVLESLVPLVMGMQIVLATDVEQQDPRQMADLIVKEQVEMVQLTPSRLHLLLESVGDDHQAWQQLVEIMVGGEAFPEGLLHRLQQLTEAKIYNLYGPTEATVWATIQELTKVEEVTIGRPLANNQVYILDEHGQLCPEKVVGELYLGGVGLARGYWQRPELTAERFIPLPWLEGERIYRTGDLARWKNGMIHFIGRKDQQFKVRGYRIEVGEIEAVLNEYPPVQESVVLGQTGPDGFIHLIGYYQAETEVVVTDLREHLLGFLPNYMIPAYFIHLEQFPMTPNGKIDWQRLPQIDGGQRPELGREYQAPVTETQQILAELWKKILKIEQVGIHDRFFELGGNSILLVQMVNRLDEIFPGQITVTDLFAFPSIGKLAEYIERCKLDQQPKVDPVRKEQEEAYWTIELAQPVRYLTLPEDYYHQLDSNRRMTSGLNLSFDLSTNLVRRLKEIAHHEEIDEIDLLTSMWIYTLAEISEAADIFIEGTVSGQLQLFPIRVQIDQIEDFSSFFHSIHEKYQKAKQMQFFPDSTGLRSGLKSNQIIPLLTTEKGWRLDNHDLVLQINIIGERIGCLCKYNETKLVKEKIQHILNGYVHLMEMLVKEYIG